MINPLRTSIVNTFKAQNSKTYKFRHSEKIIPHPEKLWKGGEDACVAHDNLLVVADGVGGWA
jgi:protein phosphatase PTC7